MAYYNWAENDIQDCWEEMNQDEAIEVAYAIARKTLIEEEGWDEDDPGFDDAVAEEADYIGLFRISTTSALYSLLQAWYEEQGKNMEEEIRGYYEDYYGDYIYFVTGTGYDIFSADLLGGTVDGRAKSEFNDFVAERF